jgi:hypothetical protein
LFAGANCVSNHSSFALAPLFSPSIFRSRIPPRQFLLSDILRWEAISIEILKRTFCNERAYVHDDDPNFDREINKEEFKTPLNKLARVKSN